MVILAGAVQLAGAVLRHHRSRNLAQHLHNLLDQLTTCHPNVVAGRNGRVIHVAREQCYATTAMAKPS